MAEYLSQYPLEAQLMLVCLISLAVLVLIAGTIGIIFPMQAGDPDEWEWNDPEDYTGAER